LFLLRREHDGIDHAAVPGHDVHFDLIKCAVLHLVEYLSLDVIREVQRLRGFAFPSEQKVNTLVFEVVIDVGVIIAVDGLDAATQEGEN
jgi:hypothetical protein